MMKKIAEFVANSSNCQQVKAAHQKLGGLLQKIQVPTWKWDDINMDFIVGLPRTQKQHDSILVVVDGLTNSHRFIPIKCTYSLEYYARIFIDEILCLHGIPVSII